MATARGTDYLNINWTLSQGRVDYYMVNISNADVPYNNGTKTTANTSTFTGLLPGRVFTVTVTAVVGVLTNMSNQASFATCKFIYDYIFKITLIITLEALCLYVHYICSLR